MEQVNVVLDQLLEQIRKDFDIALLPARKRKKPKAEETSPLDSACLVAKEKEFQRNETANELSCQAPLKEGADSLKKQVSHSFKDEAAQEEEAFDQNKPPNWLEDIGCAFPNQESTRPEKLPKRSVGVYHLEFEEESQIEF